MIDITSQINNLIPADIKNGLCHIFSLHTTAGITVNENADPDVVSDLLSLLEDLAPYAKRSYKHTEGNSDAHLKTSLVGVSQTIPISNGKLCLGTWQAVYFCEFDGPRSRNIKLTFIKT